MTSTNAGRKRVNAKTYTADDQALGQIAREAEAKLAAKRAARNEAREIRMRELEKQQKENEEKQDRLYELTNDIPKASMRQFGGGTSRRGSEDSTTDEGSREMRSQLAELDEKYKKAMMGTAQLHNEKQSLVYEVELLKDQLEEREEEVIESQREFRDKCKELESKKRSYRDLETEFKNLKIQIEQRDKLIEENGLAIVISDEGEWTLVKASAPNGPLSAGLPTMGMVNSRLASEMDASLGTQKLSSKCLASSSTTPTTTTPVHYTSSSFPTAAAAAASHLSPSTALSKQCSVGAQVSIDLPRLISSEENVSSNFDNLETVSSPNITSKSFVTAMDISDGSLSQSDFPSSLYFNHTSDTSSLYVNKSSPPSSIARTSSVWSDDDEEFYDAMNSVSDPMSPKFYPKSPKLRSNRYPSFTGGELPCSPVKSPCNVVFNDCCELFESSVDDSPMTGILDESVHSAICEGSVYAPLKVSSVDPIPDQVTSIANSLINDVFNSIKVDQDGNLNVQPPNRPDKNIYNLDQDLEIVSQESSPDDNNNEGAVRQGPEDKEAIGSDSDDDRMPNFASRPANASDDDDEQMDTDVEYLDDGHPGVKLVLKQSDSSCNESSTDEEILDDDFFVGSDDDDDDMNFCGKVVSSTPNKKMQKGYKYKTKSAVDPIIPNVNVSSNYKSYETSIGGDDSSNEEQVDVLSPQGVPTGLLLSPGDPVESVNDLKPEKSPSHLAYNQETVRFSIDDDLKGNMTLVQSDESGASRADIEKVADELSPKISSSEADSSKAFADEAHISNETVTPTSPEVLSSETTEDDMTDALTSILLNSNPLTTNQPLLEDDVVEESGRLSDALLCESDMTAPYSGNTDGLTSKLLNSNPLATNQPLLKGSVEEESGKASDALLCESDTTAPFSGNTDGGKESDKVSDEDLFADEATARPQVNDTDPIDPKTELDEKHIKDTPASVGDNIEKANLKEDNAEEVLCDSEISVAEQKDEEAKASDEDEEEEGNFGSGLKASPGVCCVSRKDVTEGGSLIDTNNNGGEQSPLGKEMTPQITSDAETPPGPSGNPSLHLTEANACSTRAEKVSSIISDLGDTSDEDIEDDGAQFEYTDDDLFEILDSPMHHSSKKISQSDSPSDALRPASNSDDPLVMNQGAANDSQTVGQTRHSQNPLSQNQEWESNSQKNKKAAGSKTFFGHFKPWKKKGKGSKK